MSKCNYCGSLFDVNHNCTSTGLVVDESGDGYHTIANPAPLLSPPGEHTCDCLTKHGHLYTPHSPKCWSDQLATLRAALDLVKQERDDAVDAREGSLLRIDGLKVDLATLQAELEAVQQKWHYAATCDSSLDMADQCIALQAELEGVKREREAYKAVLVGAKYNYIDRIPTFTLEESTYLGREASRRTKDIIIERNDLTQQLAEARFKHDELADQSSADTDRFIAIMSSLKTVCPEASSIERGVALLQQQLAAREGQCDAFKKEIAHDVLIHNGQALLIEQLEQRVEELEEALKQIAKPALGGKQQQWIAQQALTKGA